MGEVENKGIADDTWGIKECVKQNYIISDTVGFYCFAFVHVLVVNLLFLEQMEEHVFSVLFHAAFYSQNGSILILISTVAAGNIYCLDFRFALRI